MAGCARENALDLFLDAFEVTVNSEKNHLLRHLSWTGDKAGMDIPVDRRGNLYDKQFKLRALRNFTHRLTFIYYEPITRFKSN